MTPASREVHNQFRLYNKCPKAGIKCVNFKATPRYLRSTHKNSETCPEKLAIRHNRRTVSTLCICQGNGFALQEVCPWARKRLCNTLRGERSRYIFPQYIKKIIVGLHREYLLSHARLVLSTDSVTSHVAWHKSRQDVATTMSKGAAVPIFRLK